ncbi:MAG: radical SAM/Cys-rich domain protein [Gammaproteobacteria bacterium]|nr:MAG: radical SAM/Cys-rich domain protein [Gammaproteobacteria bacterium]
MLDTRPRLLEHDFPPLKRRRLEILQVNLGYRCNQQCLHCHVNAGPRRSEQMTAEMVEAVLDFLRRNPVATLDITGGAPEMNPHFRHLVHEARALGLKVMDRCNLTILTEPGFEDLAEFLAEHEVEVVASMPCYLEENVDAQRGRGVYERSIDGLRRLNALGYGQGGVLRLDLVYNPGGPFLPPPQCQLEQDYRKRLGEMHGIVFDRLLTLANMPIARFGSTLLSRGEFDDYLKLLQSAHRDENLDTVMCRSLLSVDWQGYLYDCDFNQMLGLPLKLGNSSRTHIRELADAATLQGKPIVVAGHCWGCTAGQGSSCGGALTTDE